MNSSPSIYNLRPNNLFKDKLEIDLQILRNVGSNIKEEIKETIFSPQKNYKRYSKVERPKQTEDTNPFVKATNVRNNRRNLFIYDPAQLTASIKINFKHPQNIENPNEGAGHKSPQKSPSFYKSSSTSSRRNIFSTSKEKPQMIIKENSKITENEPPISYKRRNQPRTYWKNRKS
jgi:hypothetical protein